MAQPESSADAPASLAQHREEEKIEERDEAVKAASGFPIPQSTTDEAPALSVAVAASASSTAFASPPSSRPAAARLSPADFVPSVLLGEGSYSQVYLVEGRLDGARYAMKVLNKAHLQRHGRAGVAIAEKAALSRCSHPNIVRLFHTFQDAQSLYFILELAEGGDVFNEVDELGGYPLDVVRFYTAQLLLALHYLHHTAHVLHRDVKPENMMLSASRTLKLGDFGTAKLMDDGAYTAAAASSSSSSSSTSSSSSSTSSSSSSASSPPAPAPKKNSFVGTAAYVAPEILREGSIGYGVDQWSAGCSVYQMITATTPFHAASEYLTFQRILEGQPSLDRVMDPHAADLIQRLMHPEHSRRLGCRPEDWEAIERHPFLASVDWPRVKDATAQCPPLPRVQGKKFSVVSEESMLGWRRKGADSVEEDHKRAVPDDGDGAAEERRRGETISDVATARSAAAFRSTQLSVQSEGSEGDGAEESRQQQQQQQSQHPLGQQPARRTNASRSESPQPPRSTNASTTSTSTAPSLSQSQQLPLPALRPEALSTGEAVLLASTIRRPSRPSPFAALFSCLCASPSPPPTAASAPLSPPAVPSTATRALLTSGGRVLLVATRKAGKTGAADDVVLQVALGKAAAAGARVERKTGAGGIDVLRLISDSAAQRWELELELTAGATSADWLLAVRRMHAAE